jgi:hypothetical protein
LAAYYRNFNSDPHKTLLALFHGYLELFCLSHTTAGFQRENIGVIKLWVGTLCCNLDCASATWIILEALFEGQAQLHLFYEAWEHDVSGKSDGLTAYLQEVLGEELLLKKLLWCAGSGCLRGQAHQSEVATLHSLIHNLH